LIETPGLDNVRLAGVVSNAVPEPSTFVMMTIAVVAVGMFWLSRKRHFPTIPGINGGL
jgi:hypothetical protein